jgi:hypothetical protein
MLRTVGRWILVGVIVLLVGIQLVPYGRNHTNPPCVRSPPGTAP